MAKLEKRRDSDGRIRFSFRYIDIDGTRKRHTPDVETEHDALRIMAEVRARIARGIVGVSDAAANERQGASSKLSTTVERWLRAAQSTSKNPRQHRVHVQSSLAGMIEILGDVPIAQLRRGDISRCLAAGERQGLAASTQNGRLSALSRVWLWAQDAGLIPDAAANPTRRLMKKIGARSIDFYSRAEIVRILDAAAPQQALHTLIAAALYTGMRKGELYGLRGRDITPHNATIRIERSSRKAPKSGRARTARTPTRPWSFLSRRSTATFAWATAATTTTALCGACLSRPACKFPPDPGTPSATPSPATT